MTYIKNGSTNVTTNYLFNLFFSVLLIIYLHLFKVCLQDVKDHLLIDINEK